MALSEARRASLLAYCRIEDPTAEELLTLEGLYDAAVGYMERAGVSEPEEGTPRRAQYDLCVNFIVLRDFDLREAEVSGTLTDNPAFRRLLTQLKLTEPAVSKLDTAGAGEV
ncbi:MAG: head-tail connector protein [Flavonifractor plautii]|nr:head-tail connector protein [Flavonifractor plautii]